MKVLVTGATGFLGSYVVQELLDRGHEVFAAVRKSSDSKALEEKGVHLRHFDLTDPSTMPSAVGGMDAVIHLAAYYTFFGKEEVYERLNVTATSALIDACLQEGVTRFIYCSSTEAMGAVEGLADERSELHPSYAYGRSKMKAEQVVREGGRRGLLWTIIRPSGIYGPGNVDDVSYWTITAFGRRFATKFIVGSGRNLIQFVHVRDVAQAFGLALGKESSICNVYIISGDRPYSYEEVYAMLSRITSEAAPRRHLPAPMAKFLIFPVQALNRLRRKNDFLYQVSTVDVVTRDRAFNIEKARRELGYQPRYALEDGLRETVQWYREQGYM